MTVLLVVVWVGSFWWLFTGDSGFGLGIGVHERGLHVRLWDLESPGLLRDLGVPTAPPRAGWNYGYTAYAGCLWRCCSSRSPWEREFQIPLWPVMAVCVLVTGAAWHRDTSLRRRARLKLCPKCGYDRAGLAAGAVCPECGSAA